MVEPRDRQVEQRQHRHFAQHHHRALRKGEIGEIGRETDTHRGQRQLADHLLKPAFRRPRQRNDHLIDLTGRSEEHTSELQSLMRISYAVFCLKKKKNKPIQYTAYTSYTDKNHTVYTKVLITLTS